MLQIHTLKDLDNGNKLGNSPANYYPPSRTEFKDQLSCAKKDREVAIYWGSQFADSYDVLNRENKRIQNDLNQSKKESKRIQDDLNKSKKEKEKLSNRIHQLGKEIIRLQSEINDPKLGDEIRQLHSEINDLKLQITRKDISLADAENKFIIKSEEMQALQSKMTEEMQTLQSKVKELEQDISLAQENLSEMDSFKREFELEKVELSNKNIGLFLAKEELEDLLAEKKDELLQMKDDLVLVQKILMEKDFLL